MFFVFLKNLLTPFTHFSYSSPLSLATANLVSIICELGFSFVILDSKYKRDHTVFVVHCLTYFTQQNALKVIHVVTKKDFILFFIAEYVFCFILPYER